MKSLFILLAGLWLLTSLDAQVRVQITPIDSPTAKEIASILRAAILGSSSFVIARDTSSARLTISIVTSGDNVRCGTHVFRPYALVANRWPNPVDGNFVSVGLYGDESQESRSFLSELLNDLDKAVSGLGLQ